MRSTAGSATTRRPAARLTTVLALDANDYIVSNRSTGALYYESNGSALGGAVQFATLTNKPTLTASDFVVV
jgi:Ca2+-binding RTX toxin-like protein